MRTLQENQSLNAEYERNKKEREMKEEIERLNNIIEQLIDIIVDNLNADVFEKACNMSIDDFRIWIKEKLKGEDVNE